MVFIDSNLFENPAKLKVLRDLLCNYGGIMGRKLCQYIYSRPDIISTELEEIRNIFEVVLCKNPCNTNDETARMISLGLLELHEKEEEELKGILNNIESMKLLGSGTIAEAHLCTVRGEDDVVLKVLHPNCLELSLELSVIRFLIHVLQYLFPVLVNFDWDNFFKLLEGQDDLRREAGNVLKFEAMYSGYEAIEIPHVIGCTKYFYIMTYIQGDCMSTISRDSERYKTAHKLVTASFLHSTYRYGLAHGDLHLGNILVKESGDIGIVDFGVVIDNISNVERKVIYMYNKWIQNLLNTEIANDFWSCVLHNYDIYNNPINLDIITELWINEVIKLDLNIVGTSEVLNLFITRIIRPHKLLFRGDALFFIFQINILEVTAPRLWTDETKTYFIIRTTAFMRNSEFFVSECGYFINDLYNTQLLKTPQYIIDSITEQEEEYGVG